MITRDEIAELIGVRVGHGKGERSARAVGQAKPIIAGTGRCVSTECRATMIAF